VQASIYHPRYESLRAALVATRKRAGLTQTQMAQRLGVGQSFVSKIERGDSYVEVFTCVDWCTACGITPGALLDSLVLSASSGG